MTMDLVRHVQPPGARAWRYWARMWTLNAVMTAAIALFVFATEPRRWMLWGALLAWVAITAPAAKVCWWVAARKREQESRD